MTIADKEQDISSLRELLDDQLRLDAQDVVRDMQLPVVMRVRADVNEPGSYRLLAMRTARMSSAKSLVQQRMMGVIEHTLPLELEQQRTALAVDVRRALEACLRVLESTDAKPSTELVAETAEAMSHNIGNMSTLLAARFPKFAESLAKASLDASEIAKNVDTIAKEMLHAYEEIRAQMAQTGPRTGATADREMAPQAPAARS
ncbi:hypothetical protein [Duganella sp. LjRoot269]|jgi:hypothetical protein|uniref:hypothetical protein n=1 Tax=Duganella sp. LjRoot269 TaxID=3342305 RepID=UPI003ED0D19C